VVHTAWVAVRSRMPPPPPLPQAGRNMRRNLQGGGGDTDVYCTYCTYFRAVSTDTFR
jgi:hypothetical protein